MVHRNQNSARRNSRRRYFRANTSAYDHDLADNGHLSALIGHIYDTVLDPAQWPKVLELLAGFVGGTASALFLKDSIRKTHETIYTWGYDPYYTQIYIEKYGRFDPFATAQFFFDIGEPISGADIMPHREHRKSVFYKEWVQPQRWIDAIAATLEKSATTYSGFSVIRHENDGVVDKGARRRMKLIVPHVRRAVLISKIVDLHKMEAAEFGDTLDGLATAVFLVDGAGRIVRANLAGHAMLADATVVCGSGGRLIAVDATSDHKLHDIFTNAERSGAIGIDVPMFARDGERYVAHVLPLTSGARRRAGRAYSAVAAVFVQKATIELPHPLETIASSFELTPTELRVLMMIVQVGGVPEIASVLGVSEETTRTHLKRIFSKTNTSRQADLVKLVAGYMSPFSH
jgi:DNA-binding CsgD family transcriptional regulator